MRRRPIHRNIKVYKQDINQPGADYIGRFVSEVAYPETLNGVLDALSYVNNSEDPKAKEIMNQTNVWNALAWLTMALGEMYGPVERAHEWREFYDNSDNEEFKKADIDDGDIDRWIFSGRGKRPF